MLARGLRDLLPPIEVVEGSWCQADPRRPEEWEVGLAERLVPDQPPPTRVQEAPFVTVPLGVTEDRLLGTLDLETSVESGAPCFQPGLLAQAHRGILYVDEANLLEDGIVNLMFGALDNAENVVERESLSASHPCRPLLVGTEGAFCIYRGVCVKLCLLQSCRLPPTTRRRGISGTTFSTGKQRDSALPNYT